MNEPFSFLVFKICQIENIKILNSIKYLPVCGATANYKKMEEIVYNPEVDFMKKYGWIPILVCLLVLSYHPTASQVVTVWTEKGCDAVYKPGEPVKIHYKVFERGWTRVYKRYPDTHEEEIEGWRYFPTAGEYVEVDTLGPECGRITYTVKFWQEISPACLCCPPCNCCTPCCCPICTCCGPPALYVMEAGKSMCSITVQCDMSASLSTDKTEYISTVDSEAKITLNITDVYGNSLDADSVVMDVNGQRVLPVRSLSNVYTASFTLTGRPQGEYTVTATIFKRNYPQTVKTTAFTLIVPVSVELSTDRPEYTESSQMMVRAEVRDFYGRGMSGLHFDVLVSGETESFTDLGGGIYEAQLDLHGFAQGEYTVDVCNMEEYIQVDSIRKVEFTVRGLPEISIELPSQVDVEKDSAEDVFVLLRNIGDGEAVNTTISVEAPPGIDILGISGYRITVPSTGETTVVITLKGREKGEYTVPVTVSYEDVGGGVHTVSGSFPLTVASSALLLLIVVLAAAAAAAGVGGYALIGKPREPAQKAHTEERSKEDSGEEADVPESPE